MSTPRPYPYQSEMIEWMAAQEACFNAADMGLGKSMMTVRACYKAGARSVLVVCPKSLVENWRREFDRWWPQDAAWFPRVIVVNYDKLVSRSPRHRVGLTPADGWDVLVADEAHALKNPDAKRTAYFYKRLVPIAKRVYLLSGTPAPNHAGELWPALYHLRPDLITAPLSRRPMERVPFENRYCEVVERHVPGGKKARQIVGTKKGTDLRERLMDSGFMRRLAKEDVLHDLPSLTFDTHLLDTAELKARDWKALDVALEQHALTAATGDELVTKLREAQHALATERRLTGTIKVPLVAQAACDMLNSCRKLILFAVHKDVISALTDALSHYNPVVITGDTPSRDRTAAVDKFQWDLNTRVFIGQIKACGEGITLTASSDVLFAEPSWVPAELVQAAARAHRIGQKNPVIARVCTLPHSLDHRIGQVLARKAREIAELVS